jgi:L-ribulokinase
VMQIYADILGRPMALSRSAQTCALGSAIAAAVVGGAFTDVPAAQRAMTELKATVYHPQPGAVALYDRLFRVYRELHDAFGTAKWQGNLSQVMKKLLVIRDEARRSA